MSLIYTKKKERKRNRCQCYGIFRSNALQTKMWRYDLGRFRVYTKTQHENDSFLRVDISNLCLKTIFAHCYFLNYFGKKWKFRKKWYKTFLQKWKITSLYKGLFLLFAPSLQIILKIRWEISWFERKHEILSWKFVFCIDHILMSDPHIRTQQISRINEVSEFDTHKDYREVAEFLIPLRIPGRFQNLWYP